MQAVAGPRTYAPRTDKKPSGKQVYAMAHLLVDIAGLTWPESSADASAMIGHLREQLAAVPAAASEEIPF